MRLREAVRRHAAPVAAFSVMLLVFTGFAVGMRPVGPGTTSVSALPIGAVDLPEDDADGDTYGDLVDLWEGNAVVRVDLLLEGLGGQGDLLVGTQDDQYRFGKGAELEWRHVVDHDPLGHRPGSDAWVADALRTGLWVHAASWRDGTPQQAAATLDVRDDRASVELVIEWWDTAPSPDHLRGRWRLSLDGENATLDGEPTTLPARLAEGITLSASLGPEPLDADTKQRIAERWAPIVRFDSGERFYPTDGDVLHTFHGFSRGTPELRTWTLDFDNGRDGYRLLLADFNGDRDVDHEDAALMAEILREGGRATDTVYSHVATFGDRVIVQYWFFYMFNFVLDELGNELPRLAHAGDREFMQLVFEDEAAALGGFPDHIAYSQHYRGVAIVPERGEPPFHLDDTHPAVYVARGSHASYPVAGNDRAVRTALAGYGDVFDGRGETWLPEDYEVEVLDDEPWHAGYLWGPATRFSRDLGTAARPLLLHDFTYPYTDPFHWMDDQLEAEPDQLERLYRTEDG